MLQTPIFPQECPARRRESRWRMFVLLAGMGIAAVLVLAAIYLAEPPSVAVINRKTSDLLMAYSPIERDSRQVVTVDIDERSLKEYGQWPWPRHRVATLLAKLKANGAATVGITILFPEPERNTLKNLQDLLEKDFGFRVDVPPRIASLLDSDAALAGVLADGPYVLGYSFVFDHGVEEPAECPLQPAIIDDVSLSRWLQLFEASGVVCNYRSLAGAAPASGFYNATPDPDGVVRRLPLLIAYRNQIYPSFALAVVQQSLGLPSFQARQDLLGTTFLVKNGVELPVDQRANYLLGPPKDPALPHYSAADVLNDAIAREAVAGRIVLVGTTAAGLSQNLSMPSGEDIPQLDLIRLAIEDMLTGNSTIRTGVMAYLEAGLTLLLALPVAASIALLTPVWSGMCGILMLAAVWLGPLSLYIVSGYLFSPLLPSVAIVCLFSLLHVLRYRQFQRYAVAEVDAAMGLVRQQEDTLRSILTTIPDIVFRLDRDGNITFISPAISKYLKDPKRLIGNSIFELVVPQEREKARFRLNERRTGKRATSNLEMRLQLKLEDDAAGADRYFSVSAEGLYIGNSPDSTSFMGTQGIVRDITDKKLLERQLVQAQKMEVIGSLAAGIAHDLNNILSGLVSYPDLLIMELPEDSPLREKMAVIQKSGRKAAAIVQDLLALARRNIEINEVCNLNTVVEDYLASVEFLRMRTRYPEIRIASDLCPEMLFCRGSAVHLSKVLMNALHNAMEAMPAGGQVVVGTTMAHLREIHAGYESIPPGEYVVLSVQDNGVGIAEADLGRIFEPFYTKKSLDRSGTGLGMTVIWTTVKDHRGYLDIISREGLGTTLRMYLPATHDSPGDSGSKRVVLEDYIGSETILVVDDSEDQRTITATILEKLGYVVLTAMSGETALAMIATHPVDLVILDMVMPGGLDGLETFQEMVDLQPQLRAIIVSGFSETDRVRQAMSLGVRRFIQKPYSMEQLGLAIRQVLDSPAAETEGR